MAHFCNDCWISYKSQKFLELHKNISDPDLNCNKWKNIIFTCTSCNFVTRGIKNIESHIKNCKTENIINNNQISKLSEKYNSLLLDNKNMYKKLNDFENIKNKLKDIERKLLIENTKSKIYHNLVESNTSLKVNDIISEKEESLHIHNPTDKFKIFIYENFENKNEFSLIHKDSKIPINIQEEKHKKLKYRPIKKGTEIIINNEAIAEQQNDNEKLEQLLIKHESSQPSLENINEVFNHCLTQVKELKNYTKILKILQVERTKIFNLCNLESYKDILSKQIQEIENIFRTKKYTEKKIQSIILKSLTSLETRLLSYSKYYQIDLDTDDIEKVQEMLLIQNSELNNYIPFDLSSLTSKFMNYSIVLFPLEKLLEIYLSNRFGYNTLVYVPLPKNTEDDPFSFYILEKDEVKIKKWKMDCRLENLINELHKKILPYMISLFRKLYNDVYNDNEFRSNYSNFCSLTEYDCELLLYNIVKIYDQVNFSKNIKNMIKKKFIYNPKENDKFNLSTDDVMQKKRLNEQEQEIDLVDVIRLLFNGISSKESVDLLRNKNLLK